MEDMHDFDQFINEQVDEVTHKYKLFGVEGEIPSKIPMGIPITYERNKHRPDDDKGLELTVSMLETIFGVDTVTQWARNPKFTDDVMTQVLKWALSKYGLGEEKDNPKPQRGKVRVIK